ncbi:hypothetical protein OH799_32630 [Nocardia sp. NBC_00881]|uniref:hypothetical protein n=1 Tax=Nocardia sp. NBC_00881 TaxID=2975995 RepID=UPI00386F95BA|nr:hypothetical protein OH799_32630 [Nocardia sp. NBC_00881]
MSSSELASFAKDIYTQSAKYQGWLTSRGAVPVEGATTTLTLRANSTQPVRIIRMSAIKECAQPLNGTYFQPPAEGGAEPNIMLGVDLDTSDSIFQEMYHNESGLLPSGPSYFDQNTVMLNPGETQTFTIGAFTKLYSCSFKVRIYVVGSGPAVYQDIDCAGTSFKITAPARTKNPERPLSGYQTAYGRQGDYTAPEWIRLDPNSVGK